MTMSSAPLCQNSEKLTFNNSALQAVVIWITFQASSRNTEQPQGREILQQRFLACNWKPLENKSGFEAGGLENQ